VLKAAVEDKDLDQLVRLYAYGALLQIVKGISDLGYSPHEHKLSDVDWAWVSSLCSAQIGALRHAVMMAIVRHFPRT